MRRGGSVASQGVAEAKTSVLRIFLVIYLTGLLLCAFDLADGKLFLGDIDDLMREIQIRQLMSPAGDWWGLTLPMISMPEAYVSPWSRLVDLPYLLIARLLSPVFSPDRALLTAFLIWPPVMLAVYSLLGASVIARTTTFRSVLDGLLLIAATILMLFALWEFVPGRIDHHNMQLVALMAITAGLARWDRAGGVMIGLGSVVSIAIALEGLPFVVLAFAGIVIAFVLKNSPALPVLRAASASMLISTGPLALALLGRSGSASTQCDAFSAPYIVLMIGCSAILLASSLIFHRAASWERLASIAVPAGCLMVIAGLLFPRCLAGPYWMIDPVSKHYWFDRIPQEQGLIYLVSNGELSLVLLVALLGVVIIAAIVAVLAAGRRGDLGLVMVTAVAAASLLLTIALIRYIRFPSAFVPLLLPFAYKHLKHPPGVWPQARLPVLACVGLLVATVAGLRLLMPATVKIYDAVDYMAFDECRSGDLSVLAQVPAGRIVAPQALSLQLAFTMPHGFSVAAVPFHRASPGMRRAFEALVSTDAEVRRKALEPFDYVAVCRFPLKTDVGTAPLYDALAAGLDWPGLVRLDTGPTNPFQLFRIDHVNLR
ncbi:hypothetical protein E2F50_01755 [Rhizobium deserti]|uniref:Glycosyltransferase RgtA/B/C/D-like domain-containing protein n=1 Tax=Rhizobium deserti TaxID=2547961 RepID=A0A4R5UM02_9HYPH|nr:hypothetical protein [Rhizobium deserti]TDK38892.1 hypothetical protein E2F50_01755 [Rhizobium deserti]